LGHGEKGPQQGHLLARPEDLRQGPNRAAQGHLFGIWRIDGWGFLGNASDPGENVNVPSHVKKSENGTSRKVNVVSLFFPNKKCCMASLFGGSIGHRLGDPG